jgi:hypothetical protein
MSLLREAYTATVATALPDENGSVLTISSSGTAHVATAIRVTSVLHVRTAEGIFVAEASDVEAAGIPVVGGGILYVSDGKLKYRGTNGTVTTVADA